MIRARSWSAGMTRRRRLLHLEGILRTGFEAEGLKVSKERHVSVAKELPRGSNPLSPRTSCHRKAARVHFEGGEATSKGSSKDVRSGSLKDAPAAAADSKLGPEKQGEAYVGVTIPR